MKSVRLGLIGAGWVADQHLQVISAIDGVEAVGITSRTCQKAEALAEKYGVTSCYDSVEGLVADAKPDALMVLVNEDQTLNVSLQAMTYDLPLFIEKPAGINPEENLKLLQEAERLNIKTMVGYNRRYYSIFHKGLKIIKDHGALFGIFVEGHERMWRIRDSKNFSDKIMKEWVYANSTHTIDLIRFFAGPVKMLKAISQNRFNEARCDQMAAVMECESGAIGQYQSHWYSPGGWRVVLYGDGVTVEFKPLEQGRWTDKRFQTHEIMADEPDTRFKFGFYGQMQAFAEMVRFGQLAWPGLDLKGAYQTMRLAELISGEEQG